MKEHRAVLILCICIIFSILFNFAVISMSVVYILSDLGSSVVTASYATAFYGIGNVITVPLALGLKDRIGTTKFFVICQTCFILATLLAGLSTTYPLFIFFRFLQGLSSGPLFMLLTSFLGSLGTAEERKTLLRYTLTSFICAPIIGASWGGWIAYDYNWRYIFAINIPLMIFLGILLFLQLQKYPQVKLNKPFDFIGHLSFAIGFFSIGFFLTLGQELDWFRSELITASFFIGIIFFLFFILWSLNHPNPIMDFTLFKQPILSIALINVWILFAIYFGMTLLLSIWLTIYVRYTVIWVSVLLGVMLFSAALLLHVMRNYLDAHRVWIPFGLGIALLGYSCFYTSNFNVDIDFGRIAYSRIIGGFGFALLLPTLVYLIIHDKDQETSPRAFMLFQMTRSSSSALGVTIFYTIWLRREVFYYERLGGGLTRFSPPHKRQ